MGDIRWERIDEGKIWSACPNCASLRGEVERLREAVEWIDKKILDWWPQGVDGGVLDELRRRAGEGE